MVDDDDVAQLFQSAPPHGERPYNRIALNALMKFQSAPPHGERRASGQESEADRKFQSAPPHGERREISMLSVRPWSFQSAPPHGERRRSQCHSSGRNLFQSAPPHGERPVAEVALVLPQTVSIRAPARGATWIYGSSGKPGACFNPRPRTGSDVAELQQGSTYTFQSAPPHGERRSP